MSTTKTKKSSAKAPQTMEELLATSLFQPKPIKRGSVVEGTIVSITPVEVLVDIGGKSEGVIAGRELGYEAESLKVGEKILAYVMQSEDESGQTILSLKRAGGERRWRELETEFAAGNPVPVRGLEVNRGGLVTDVGGVRGFIPSSQLDSANSGTSGIGKSFTAKIIEFDRRGNRLILSQKVLTAEANKKKFEEAASKFKAGETYDGKVSGVMPYGLFVTLDEGVEGLVHISEVSWDRVATLSDQFKIGDSVKVKILSVDPSAGRINLSIRALTADPWKDKLAKMKSGDKLQGTVTKVNQFGVFVELEKGIDGLIRAAKIPEYMVEIKPGSKLDVVIDEIHPEQRRIGLLVDEGTDSATLKPIEELVSDTFTESREQTTEIRKEKEQKEERKRS